MKTGFICASGFNLVATATRNGRRLIAIVYGAPSSSVRALQAAELLEQGFAANPLSWLMPTLGNVEDLQPINVSPPDLHEEMCGKHRRRAASEDEDDSDAIAKLTPNSSFSAFLSSLRTPSLRQNLLQDVEVGEPVVVFTGSSPRKPSAVSKTAAVHPKPTAKAGDDTTSRPAKKITAKPHASSDPWSNLSPASLANSPPPELGVAPAKPRPAKKPAAGTAKAVAQKSEKSTVKPAPAKTSKPSHEGAQKNLEEPDKR
jgi:D-alanyl-D-alanine carboxypeptidase